MKGQRKTRPVKNKFALNCFLRRIVKMDEKVKIVKIVKIGSSVKIPGQKIYTVEAAGYHAPF